MRTGQNKVGDPNIGKQLKIFRGSHSSKLTFHSFHLTNFQQYHYQGLVKLAKKSYRPRNAIVIVDKA